MKGVESRLDGSTLIVSIPMQFQRRGGRKRIVAPDGSEIAPTIQPDGTLVKALARAWRWQRMLDEGVYASVSEIGDAENISKSYVSRILRLAHLAPDIVESILAPNDGSGADAGDARAAAAGVLGGAAKILDRKLFPLRGMPLKRVESDGGRDRKRLRRRLLQPMVGSKPTVGRHATGWELRWCRAFCEHHLK